MAAPELLHSAPEIPRQLGELGQLFSPDSLQHLSDTLRSLGHPYGLLLNHQDSSQRSLELSSKTSPIPLVLPLLPLFAFSEPTINIISSGKPLSLGAAFFTNFLEKVSDEISSNSDELRRNVFGPNYERVISRDVLNEHPTTKDTLRFIAPISTYLALWLISFGAEAKIEGLKVPLFSSATLAQSEIEMPRPQQLQIGPDKLILGTSSIKLSSYRGQEPFTIKTPDGQPVAEIQPDAPLAALHVSHQAARFRRLSPLEKAHAMVADVTQLLSAIDQTDPQTLNPDQQTTLAQARDATIIGISHLVRLFRRQTGLPTWKLDVLPLLLQRFHALDSQAVSTQFGGKRRVRPSDIEMLVITPTQRRQLLANLQA